jgi:bifunctional DNA-binding transcriptional regulator/antitoxin component of YhaV-PrlF toxin-antitoxin module
LPAAVRRQAGLSAGDNLWVRVEEPGVVVLMTAEAAVRRAQQKARELFGDKLPSVDDFLADKREEVEREELKMRRLLGEEEDTGAVDEVA